MFGIIFFLISSIILIRQQFLNVFRNTDYTCTVLQCFSIEFKFNRPVTWRRRHLKTIL